jgi:hypothetical protein
LPDLSGILRSPSLGTPSIVIIFPIPTNFPQASPSPIVPYDYRYWIIRDPIVSYEALSLVSNAENNGSQSFPMMKNWHPFSRENHDEAPFHSYTTLYPTRICSRDQMQNPQVVDVP